MRPLVGACFVPSASPQRGEVGVRGARATDEGRSARVAPHPSRRFAASHLLPKGGKGRLCVLGGFG
jgi:hypothetical protein